MLVKYDISDVKIHRERSGTLLFDSFFFLSSGTRRLERDEVTIVKTRAKSANITRDQDEETQNSKTKPVSESLIPGRTPTPFPRSVIFPSFIQSFIKVIFVLKFEFRFPYSTLLWLQCHFFRYTHYFCEDLGLLTQ